MTPEQLQEALRELTISVEAERWQHQTTFYIVLRFNQEEISRDSFTVTTEL